VLIALEWRPYRDPLTGFGLRGYIGYVGFHVALAAVVVIAFCRRWHLLGSLLAGLALFLAPTVPSKHGVEVRVSNTTDALLEVTVARTDISARHIVLAVAAGQTADYRSAAGDYQETLQFTIECGSHRLPVTVAELRTHRIRVTDSGLLLVEIRRD
jgi:hypothetical protein